jgi:hypothetical protein
LVKREALARFVLRILIVAQTGAIPTFYERATSLETFSRIIFAASSAVLMLLALALVAYGLLDLVLALSNSWRDGGDALLTAIGYIVISIAVFDVAKYFVEEEVIRRRELRIASEARRSLTKFISTIAIALFVEGVVTVFQVSKKNVEQMLYPTALLAIAILIVLGLGIYQRLSVKVERQLGQNDATARAPKKTRRI